MITKRASNERGHFDHDWLKTYHTFSFADYYDEAAMGFGPLRVINEDFVAPGKGFGAHPHRDMEILTYILEGALEHKDSMGTGSVIKPGDIQHMSAGTGVTHSEFNPSDKEPVHLLQIWLMPRKRGIQPTYDQKFFSRDEKLGKLVKIASGDENKNGAISIEQDTDLYASVLTKGQSVSHDIALDRGGWLQVARGAVTLNGIELDQGDGAAISKEDKLTIVGRDAESEVLLFDMG